EIRHSDRHFSSHAYLAQRTVDDARLAPVRCHKNMLGAGIGGEIEALLVGGNADISIPEKRLSVAGVAEPPVGGDGDIDLAGGQIASDVLCNADDIYEDAGGGNAQPLDQRGDDDLDRVIGCRNPKSTLGSSRIEPVVPQRSLDFGH